MNKSGIGGFGYRSRKQHIEDSTKGGKKNHPKKGFGSLTKKERKENSRKALNKRWSNNEL